MIIKQIYTYNNYRNFNYLIGCEKTREAIAVDPLAYKLCLEEAKKNDLKIVSIINTHEHLDHTGGNRTFDITQSSTLDNDWLKTISSGNNGTVCVIQNDAGTSTSC